MLVLKGRSSDVGAVTGTCLFGDLALRSLLSITRHTHLWSDRIRRMLGMSSGSRSDQELLIENSCTESSVDDLGTCRGVVLSRAATILRSIETQPPTGRFVVHCNNEPFKPYLYTPSCLRSFTHVCFMPILCTTYTLVNYC